MVEPVDRPVEPLAHIGKPETGGDGLVVLSMGYQVITRCAERIADLAGFSH